jgi:PPK2 family polyphosphate:nucleotide phosphotransferase
MDKLRHQLTPGRQAELSQRPTSGKTFCDDRDAAERKFEKLRQEFIAAQRMLWAEGQQKLLIVLQAMDTGGKDGTIRDILQGVNPQGVHVASFKAPSLRELSHDFLWRIHRDVPAAGMIGVFNRSHYEDVLVVRVRRLAPESVWRPRYEQINLFERILLENDTVVLKFMLHISREEQRERLLARLEDPKKHWKFNADDLRERDLWDEYTAAYREMLERTSTIPAPWYVVPADDKAVRNVLVARVVAETLERMDPRYPGAPPEVDALRKALAR